MEAYERSYQLLTILQSYAPDGTAQQMCADFYAELQAAGFSGRELDLRLMYALHDGLQAGNWLWDPPPGRERPSGPILSAERGEPREMPSARTGAMPALVPCEHCSDGVDPTGYCTRRDCPRCRESRERTQDSTCGVCGGMLSVREGVNNDS